MNQPWIRPPLGDVSLALRARQGLAGRALVTLLVWLLLGQPAQALGNGASTRLPPSAAVHARLAQRPAPKVSLDQAVSRVRARFGGRVIRAETKYDANGEAVHHVKLLLPDGAVRAVRVDGRTGRIR
jgi:hypothetical protein